MLAAWSTASRRLRTAAIVLIIALWYGTAVHVVQLAVGGFEAYTGPTWLQVYFTSLVVLDPVAAILLMRRRRSGLLPTAAVLVSDAVANGYANYVLDPAIGVTVGRIGQAVISGLAVLSVVVAYRAWSPDRFSGPSPARSAGRRRR